MSAQELQNITSMGWSIVVIGIQVLIIVGIVAFIFVTVGTLFRPAEERVLMLQIQKQKLENIANGLPADFIKPTKTPEVNFDFKITGNTRD